MATFTKLLGLQSGVQAVAQSGDTINFTGFTLTGFSTTSIDDGTGDLTLDGSGGLSSTGITTMALDSSDTTNLSMTANDAGDKTLTIAASNAGAGLGILDLNADTFDADGGLFDLDLTGALQIDAGANSNLSVASADLTVETTTSGDMTISSAGTLGVTGTGQSDFGDGVAVWSFDGAGAVTETGMTSLAVTPSGSITLTAGAASTWSTTAGALTLDGADGVNIAGNAGEVDITTTGAIDLNGGSATLDTTGAFDATFGAASTVTMVDGAGGGSARALVFDDGTDAFLGFDTATESVEISKALLLNGTGTGGVPNGSTAIVQNFGSAVSDGAITQYDLFNIKATDADYATLDADNGDNFMGVLMSAATTGAGEPVVGAIGGIAPMNVAGSPAASNIGQFVYAGGGANAGKGVLTPPTTSGARVQIVGVLHSHNGGPGGIATVKLQPQFLYDVP